MLIQIFRPPNDGDKLMDCKLGDICDSLSLEYEDFFCGVGTFTLELPVNTVFADKISENVLLYCRDDDICFIVKNILEAVDKLTITGYTLNGLLRDRLTMPRETGVAGAEGKDCISGSTETCVKHFVDYNMISSDDGARNYPRLAVAEDMGRGLAEDSNLVGMECVDDVVRSMCESAGLGYRISLNIDSNASGPLLIFDVGERVDRTANQSERNRVIFSVGLKNITGMQRETGITAEKNALWCDTGGLNGFVFKGDEAPISWNRREDYISLAVTDEYSESEIQLFARKEMADKFAETDSLTIDAGNPLDYGTLYKLGDIVTVWDKNKSVQLNSVISAVTVKRSGTEHTVSLTLGESKPKLLDSYAKQTDILKKNQRDFPASEIVNTTAKLGTLTTYTYLTDNSIEYNGTTYTVEKNDSGLITKIANDKGGEFAPEIGGDITDVAFHNAVFTAVAMLCGLQNQDNIIMLYNQGNECVDVTGGWELWHNYSAIATEQKNIDHIYIKSAYQQTTYGFVFAATATPVDLTGYNKLHFEVIAPTSNASDYSDYGISEERVDMYWGNNVASGVFGRFNTRTDIVLDITAFSGLHYINTLVDVGNELYIYKVWLEK